MGSKANRKKILEDTMKFYSEDTCRRSVNTNGRCRYLSENGNMCAFGRYLPKTKLKIAHEREGASAGKVMRALGIKTFKGEDSNFWNDVQGFHDHHHFWNEEGLTCEGEAQYEKLLERYTK